MMSKTNGTVQATPMQGPVSVTHAARKLNVSTGCIRRLIESGGLTAYRIGRNWRIFQSDMEIYLAKTSNRRSGSGAGIAA